MATEQHISSDGIKLITSFEGFVGHPYQDAVGVWTIGYGHTQGVGPTSRSISQAEGYALLRKDLANKYEPSVQSLHLPTQAMFDAAVSVVYNLGPGVVQSGHSLGDALHARKWHVAANAILLYDKAGEPPRALPGLTRRRRAERKLFLKGLQVVRLRAELHRLTGRVAAIRAAIKKNR